MPNLPSEIITEVLLRLPVKTLLRCRCLSKPWCSFIDGPDFFRSHIHHSLQTSSKLSIIVKIFKDVHLYTIGGFDNEVFHEPIDLYHPLMYRDNICIKVLGSCDGLLCISNIFNDMALWNPHTRKHHVLPFLPLEQNRYFGASFICYHVFGFGYDYVSDDYKIVRIALFEGCPQRIFESEVNVYCLRKNMWRRISDMPYFLDYPTTNGVFASGALHWVAKNTRSSNVANLVVAFDLDIEEFRQLPKPEVVDDKFHIELGVLRGCLCLLAKFKIECVDVWVMNEYGLKESWSKLFSIKHQEGVGSLRSLKPLAYSKSGNEVLIEHDDGSTSARLYWYDLRKKEVKNVLIPSMPPVYKAEVCFNSLVSLNPDRPFNRRP